MVQTALHILEPKTKHVKTPTTLASGSCELSGFTYQSLAILSNATDMGPVNASWEIEGKKIETARV